jgi:guanylate kinase
MEGSEVHARLKEKLEKYQPSAATITLVRSTPILLLAGISGAGKDSITNELLKTGKYYTLVSHTTRSPRENDGVMEQDGVEYHFITLEESERMVDNGAYVEANIYGSNVYGTSAAEVQAAHDAHKIAVTDLEVQGVADYMKIDPNNTKAVFILPPDYEVWQSRLAKRYGAAMDQADFEKRMATALQEIEHALRTPYFSFVINNVLEDAVAEVGRIASGQPETAEKEAAHRVANALAYSLKLSIAAHQPARV